VRAEFNTGSLHTKWGMKRSPRGLGGRGERLNRRRLGSAAEEVTGNEEVGSEPVPGIVRGSTII